LGRRWEEISLILTSGYGYSYTDMMVGLKVSALLLAGVGVLFATNPGPATAFKYPLITNPSLFPNSVVNDPQQNLIKNPWFRNNCSFSIDYWQTEPAGYWGNSYKTQDPTDENCPYDNWSGTAARFAREGGSEPFYPNIDAKLFQIVGPVDPTKNTLHFHALLVAHRVNRYRAAIYGGNNASGPWTQNPVWEPFNIVDCLTKDCVNETYGKDYEGVGCNPHPIYGRDCLWEDVTENILGLTPMQVTIPQGYQYYNIEFLMRYPDPNPSLSTGDVGGKLARVYFNVSGTGGEPTVKPTSRAIVGDLDQDGDVDYADYLLLLQGFGSSYNLFQFNGVVGNFGK
jgi:hypothetical protein